MIVAVAKSDVAPSVSFEARDMVVAGTATLQTGGTVVARFDWRGK